MLRLLLVAATIALAPSAYAADEKQMEENKKVVLQLYEAAINQKDFEAASKFLGPRYIQHNPRAADGPEGLKAFLAFLREKFPDYHSEIKRVFADGDYVILHVHNVPTPGSRGNAIIDIFRLENGKVVEHWDVRQEIPEQSANVLVLVAAAAGQHGARGAVRPEIVDAVDRQEIGKARTRAVHPALDGADRAAADVRRVLIGEARGADQDQRLALIGRQLRQRGAKFAEFNAAGLLRM